MGKNLDKQIITRRLTLIKYLYCQGVEQSKKAETIAGFSLLHFHDAVEMFLLLVAENLGEKKFQDWSFMQFWKEIPDLTMEAQMNSMKNRRVSLKHHGAFPSHDDIEECRINVGTFLKENTKIQFSIDFSDISLADLVSFKETKNNLNKAQIKLKEGDYFQCLIFTRIAFVELLNEFENTKDKWYSSILEIGEDPRDTYKEAIRAIDERAYYHNVEWFDGIDKTVKELRNVVKLTAIGVDYKRYALFNVVAPKVYKWNGEYHSDRNKENFYGTVKANEELCEMCINFIIDTAIKLQESDYDTSKYIFNPDDIIFE